MKEENEEPQFNESSGEGLARSPRVTNTQPTGQKVKWGQELPKSWKVLDSTFNYFNLTNVQWIHRDIFSNPISRIDDGCNDLMVQDGEHGRCKVAKILIAQDSGDYFDGEGNLCYEG